ncbi:MAG: hypothetical protein GY898_01460 [Proteobacteria bacterium]|nr:hypothetical protein [Pseudomonadota bacterium]
MTVDGGGMIEQLEVAWARSDAFFEILTGEGVWLERPIGLRHPFVFYLGHLPAFAWNQVGRGVLGLGHHHRTFDVLFERGIDPEEASSADDVAAWPEIAAVEAYRDEVRARIREVAPQLRALSGDALAEGDRVLHLVIEHEQMHHETLMYMLMRLDPRWKQRPDWLPPRGGGPRRRGGPRASLHPRGPGHGRR